MVSFLLSLSQDSVIEVPYFDYDSRQVKYDNIDIEVKGMKAAMNDFLNCLGYGRMVKDD